jgi:hypothetical protein
VSASLRSLLLYDLLAPEFLGGFTFPSYIDQYLKLLAVSSLTMTSDDTSGTYTGGVLYTGTVFFPSSPGDPAPVTQHTDPSGAVFQWSDVNFQFRLRTWREGSTDVQTVVNAVSGITSGSNTIQGLFNNFNPNSGAPLTSPDYPGLRCRLELLVSVLTFHMGSDWVPGIMDSTYHVVQDTASASTDVEILLPKITLVYEQVENFSQAPSFSLASWGSSGFDAPSDLGAGQLVTMQPPLALHTSKRVAFSVQNILLDLSPNDTPSEILSMFGVGSDFTGVYIKAMQFYYSDADKDFAFNVSVQDALISFQGQVWLEAELDLMFDAASHPNSGGLSVTPKFIADNVPLQFNDSTQTSDPSDQNNVVFEGGSIAAPPNVYLQLMVTGGVPPYTCDVEYTSSQAGSSPVAMWDKDQNQAYFTPPTFTPPTKNDSGSLVITITDSTTGTPLKYTNTYAVTLGPIQGTLPNGAPEDTAVNATIPLATFTADARPSGIPAGYQIAFTPSTTGTIETLIVTGCSNPVPTATAAITPQGGSAGPGQALSISASGMAILPVNPGDSIAVSVNFPAQNAPSGTYKLYFNYGGPTSDAAVTSYSAGAPSPDDPIFDGNTIPSDIQRDGASHSGGNALTYWVKTALDTTKAITISGQSSYEGYDGTQDSSQALSQRRANVAQNFVNAAGSGLSVTATGNGQTAAQSSGSVSNPQDRVAVVTGTPVAGQPQYTLTGTLARAATAASTAAAAALAPSTQPNTPPAGSNSSKPPSLKRLSFRVRLEKNIPVMMEISGEIDFQQQTQSALQSASGNSSGNLGMQNQPGATGNKNAGPTVVDFLLNVTYDTATCDLTETLALGSGPASPNGLLQVTNGTPSASGPPTGFDTFKNILGSVMIFTPIINAATTAIDPGSTGEWTDVALSLGLPIAIASLGWINSSLITLYGGTLVARQNVPSGLGSTKFTAASLTFDYGVSFWINVSQLGIQSSRALSVRYKAFGFSLNFAGTPAFQFVFDTSKGYTLDLSDPSLFNLPGGLGDLLKIAGARIAQFNPLTIEIDLVIKQDLGVITVDEFLIKLPLEDGGVPMILPSGIHVNLPGVLTGGGNVKIQNGGFEGGFDLTLVALSLRVAAQVGVEPVSDPSGRKATAFYLSVEVDFPTPIILGDTGLGIFGLYGLFAMHYMRNLPPQQPGNAYGPDLQWLIDAGGQPQDLFNPNPPSPDLNPGPDPTQNWVPNLGSWGFGVGALLGTVDGFLLTMRGTFILTLPGPQIIITVNLMIIVPIDTGDGGIDPDGLTIGILGILDLDFNLGQITIGVSMNLSIEDLISIVVPISIFFSWNDPDTWHVWIGTIQTPISANILGIVKGSGFFMFGGQAIENFPPGSSGVLPGVAVAVGFSASIIWGSEDIDIYLAVVVSAYLGVSFSPSLFIAGEISLSGKLQLLIVSIGASGSFQITAPNPFTLNVQVCGSVSFFFFSVSACCGFSIGPSAPPPPPPPPLINRLYLQSYAPVIASGQGGARPIDSSLGNGLETVTNPSVLSTLPPASTANNPPKQGPDPNNLIVVPIDTVPVLQFEYAADASTITNTFTENVPQCPMFPTNIGGKSVSLGGGRTAVYALTNLSISAVSVGSLNAVNPPLPTGTPAVPIVWRKNTPANNKTANRVDLAIFSRDPNIASHAIERSTTLNGQLNSIWNGLCDPIAPPACVLWTFCNQPVDYPQTTWNLTGIPTPDPPGTTRTTPVPTAMEVTAPSLANASALFAVFGPLFGFSAFQPARVIGIPGNIRETGCMRGLELPEILVTSLDQVRTNLTYSPVATPILKSPEAEARLKSIENNWRWVRLDIGPSTQVSLYMALDRALARFSFVGFGDTSGLSNLNAAFGMDVDLSLMNAANLFAPTTPIEQASAGQGWLEPSNVVIRERDASGALLRESTLASLNPNLVIGTAGLPSSWTDPTGPWWNEIQRVTSYFNAGLAAMSKVFVQFTPLTNTSIVEVAEVGPVLPDRPTVVIGAVQGCSEAEQERNGLGIEVQNSQITTLEGYLDGGSPVPLLIPNTEYTITVQYNVTTTEADGTTVTNYNGVEQGFTFQTDSTPPDKLDPWVLAALPATQEQNAFYDDPVTIVFNDQEAIQLFAAYGEKLVMELHAANGLDDPTQSVSATVQVSGIGPAGYDSLLNLIQQGALPCVGTTTSYQNAQFIAQVDLQPLMAYTLDINMDPAPAQSGSVALPLYRTRFTTSKYASLNALATDLGTSRVKHAHLSGPLNLNVTFPAPSPYPPNSPVNYKQVTDQLIESAFVAAGEQALPAAADNSITVYWIPGPGNGPYVPYCILIDCTEPLWRTRQEPSLVPVDPSDPSFNIVQITPASALEVIETGGSSIHGFAYSPSGTRTIALFAPGFSPPPAGTTVTLELHRPASSAFSLVDVVGKIVDLQIGPQAPWEADHV